MMGPGLAGIGEGEIRNVRIDIIQDDFCLISPAQAWACYLYINSGADAAAFSSQPRWNSANALIVPNYPPLHHET